MAIAPACRAARRQKSRQSEPKNATFEVMARWYRSRRPWGMVVVEGDLTFGEMVGWYAELLGVTAHEPVSNPIATWEHDGLRAAWIGCGQPGRRVVIVALSRGADDRRQGPRRWDQHLAFEYPDVVELQATHARLRGLGIEPFHTAAIGSTTALYYEDPDGNSVELTAHALESRG